LDAVQIEKLTFTYAGKPAFMLQKEDKSWRVAGQFDAKVNEKALTDTLDALAELKAERYAADQNPNLQLYGLTTPALTIKIQTISGERVLNIGRQEGESERRYVTVAGADGAPVFVMSESDARRIVRTLQQFTDAKTEASLK